jgi:hypothetical protein
MLRARLPRNRLPLAGFTALICLLAAAAFGQGSSEGTSASSHPEAEFHMARVIYRTFGGGGSHGFVEPWWAIDYPVAEQHFLPALRRLTRASVADDSRHLNLTDERIFDYPFLFLQQPGRGNWRPSDEDAKQLREYLQRGGFLLIDDFHSAAEWPIVQRAVARVLPGREIVEIPDGDPVLRVVYDLKDRLQIPGRRHLWISGGRTEVHMEGPASWRGIYDDRGRLVIAMNYNIDMGDGWEHADDPVYPAEMTVMAYRLGINYVIYSMSH